MKSAEQKLHDFEWACVTSRSHVRQDGRRIVTLQVPLMPASQTSTGSVIDYDRMKIEAEVRFAMRKKGCQ
jgi:hypothetical protein